jgi:hypothetical protein
MIGLKLASEEYQFLHEDYEKEQRRRDAEEHGLSIMEEDDPLEGCLPNSMDERIHDTIIPKT